MKPSDDDASTAAVDLVLDTVANPDAPRVDTASLDAGSFDAASLDAAPADAASADAARPTAPGIFRIVAIQERGDGSILTIDAGSNLGIDTRWHGGIVDDDGKRVENGAVEIESVSRETCRLRSTLSAARVREKYRRVLIKYYP